MTTITSNDASTVVNQILFEYTKLWQIDNVWQEVDGEVDTNPMTESPKVSYTYDNDQVADGNHSRMNLITYPNGESYQYEYTGTVNNSISRLTSIRPGGIGIGSPDVAYQYIGLGMVATVDLGIPDVQLDYQVQHNGERNDGEYAGFDRFGRVIHHPWVDGGFDEHATLGGVPNIPPIVELTYAYDKASNRLNMLDGRPGVDYDNRDMVYTYDGLDRLKEAKRGVDPPSGTFSPAIGSEKWSLDMLGNWSTFETDLTGDGDYADTNETTNRDHNDVNELIGLDLDDNSTFELTPTYDDAGNMREHPINSNTKYRYTHDLWNRLVKVEIEKGGSWNDVSEYEYFGTHWRSLKKSDTGGGTGLDEKREMYYTAGWQLIEERIDDDYINNAGIDRNMQYLWGGRYIDDIIMHREDHDGDGSFTSSTHDSTWWHLTDVQFSTVAILDEASNLAERVKYDSYGRALHHDWRDVDGDRDYDSTDRSAIATIAISLGNQIGDPAYRSEADLNRDGTIDSNDLNLATTNYNAALSSGTLSNAEVKNTIGWDGYVFNPEMSVGGLYTVRFRTYSPDAGRWLQRDPLGTLIVNVNVSLNDVDNFLVLEEVQKLWIFSLQALTLVPFHPEFQYDDGNNILSYGGNDPFSGVDPLGGPWWLWPFKKPIQKRVLTPIGSGVGGVIGRQIGKQSGKRMAKKIARKQAERRAKWLARCELIYATYKSLDCRSCKGVTDCEEATKRAACFTAELIGRRKYLRNRCDFILPGSIRKGSEKAQKGHEKQVLDKVSALGICAKKIAELCPGECP